MKVCLSSRQTKEYLQKSDEIKVKYKDNGSIFDLIEEYPDKTIILDCLEAEIDWKLVERYKILAKNNFMVCVGSINELRQAASLGIRRYFGYPVSSFWELEALKAFEVEYIKPDIELFFQLDKVAKAGIKIRVTPNLAYTDAFPHKNGILGQWIRPEDIESVYGRYVNAVEFADCDIRKEQALYRIYFEEKEWRTSFDIIITNLNSDGAVNRMLRSEISEARTTCGQKCLKGGGCRLCERAFALAHPDIIKEYKDAIQ